MAVRSHVAGMMLTIMLAASEAACQEPPVPPVVIRSLESQAVGRTVTYGGRCGQDDISVRVETDDPVAPSVTVARADVRRTYDLSEPFVRDIFFGHRYDLVELTCYDEGLALLVLMHVARNDEPVYLVGSVYFDREMSVSQYDGLGVDDPSVIERFDLTYYERLRDCRDRHETRAEVQACVRSLGN